MSQSIRIGPLQRDGDREWRECWLGDRPILELLHEDRNKSSWQVIGLGLHIRGLTMLAASRLAPHILHNAVETRAGCKVNARQIQAVLVAMLPGWAGGLRRVA